MSKRYLVDTNVLLEFPEVLQEYDVVINSDILRELESLERKHNGNLQWKIRRAKKVIEENKSKIFEDLSDYKGSLDGYDQEYVDNKIIAYALEKNLGIISYDRLVRLKAEANGIEWIDPSKKVYDEYSGFKEVIVNKMEMADVYGDLTANKYDLLINQYIVFVDEHTGEEVDVMKWTGKHMLPISQNKNRRIKFSHMNYVDDLYAKDSYQVMAIESVLNNQLTVIRGEAGSGKSLIALSMGMYLMENEDYKLVIFANPTPSKNAQELGFRKGTTYEKLMESSSGIMLKSKLGGEDSIMRLISEGRLEILPMVDIRGYDTGSEKVCVWIVEAQNLDIELMRLALQRVTESAKVIIDGDDRAQVDRDAYAINNGMKRVSEVFRGSELYGEVELQNVWRSRLADLANKL